MRRGADELVKALVPDAAMGLNFAVLDAASPREVAQELADPAALPRAQGGAGARPRVPRARRRAGGTRWARRARRGRRASARRARGGCWRWRRGRAGAWTQLDPGPGRPRRRGLEGGAERGPRRGGPGLPAGGGGLLPRGAHHRARGRRERAAGAVREGRARGARAGARGHGRGREEPAAQGRQGAGRGSSSARWRRGSRTWTSSGAARVPGALQEAAGPGRGGARSRSGWAATCGCCSRSWRSWRSTSQGPSSRRRTWRCWWATRARRSSSSSPTRSRSATCARRSRYAEDAMGQGTHALQLLGAVATIIRGAAGEPRADEPASRGGQPPRSFDDFKSRIFPEVEQEAKASKGRASAPLRRPSSGCRPRRATGAGSCCGAWWPAPRRTWRSSPPEREARPRAPVVDRVPSRVEARLNLLMRLRVLSRCARAVDDPE